MRSARNAPHPPQEHTTATTTTTTTPTPGKAYIACLQCENRLGEVIAGMLVVRHERRTIAITHAAGLAAIECEDCGRINRFSKLKRWLAAITIDVDDDELPAAIGSSMSAEQQPIDSPIATIGPPAEQAA